MKTHYLEDSRHILEKINQSMPCAVYIYDLPEHRFTWFSNRALTLVGQRVLDAGKSGWQEIEKILHPDDLDTLLILEAQASKLKDGEIITAEYRVLNNQDGFNWLNDRITPFARDENGQLLAVMGVSTDITERKQYETSLMETLNKKTLSDQEIHSARAKMISSAKMAALGEMAGGIAHEINNPLTVIQGRAFQIKQILDSDNLDQNKIREAAESIARTAEKIASIIRSLRSFSREGSSDPLSFVTVKQIIDETLEFCRTRFYNHGVEIEIEPVDPDLEIECRVIEIQQVLLNLLNNSFDAIQSLPEKWIRVAAEEKGSVVEFRVIDSGAGIPPKIAAHILKPFFTTKEAHKGTGLGLSISSEIVKSHNGELFLDSTQPNTTFVFRLPH